jgi:muramoyltetrapeptide carboxypeptidase
VTAAAASWIKPRRLAPGDRIALVAPASPFKREDLDAGEAELRTLGFDVTYAESVFARRGFVAGDPCLRAEAIADAWRDPSVAAIVAMRGGYGSAELLPLLDPALLRRAAKIFCGYSDVTTLLTLHLMHGVVAFHGPMVERRLAAGEAAYHRDSFLRALTRAEPLGPLQPPGLQALKGGEAAGILVGGTMTQIIALLGTPWSAAYPSGCVLFLEDVAERPYRIRRMLTQLTQSGIIGRASALVFGEFPSCDEPGGVATARDVIADALRDFTGPILFGFPSGHTTGATWTLPFGVRARVRTSPPTVDIEEAAVA